MDATTIVLVLALLLADRLARIIEQLVRELRRQRRSRQAPEPTGVVRLTARALKGGLVI